MGHLAACVLACGKPSRWCCLFSKWLSEMASLTLTSRRFIFRVLGDLRIFFVIGIFLAFPICFIHMLK